jgi:hypothetical protein
MSFSTASDGSQRVHVLFLHSLFLSFDYLPLSRSSDPTTTLPGCVANIKELPNEWYQVTSIVGVETQPHLDPVFSNVNICLRSVRQGDKTSLSDMSVFFQLFVPTARVYPLTDPIPFHVEI